MRWVDACMGSVYDEFSVRVRLWNQGGCHVFSALYNKPNKQYFDWIFVQHPLASDCEFHYNEETTFYSMAVSIVRTVLCVLPYGSSLHTVIKLTI